MHSHSVPKLFLLMVVAVLVLPGARGCGGSTTPQICTSNATQNGTTTCGLNREGVYVQACVNGGWVDNATCTGTDICVNGSIQDGTTTCGQNSEGVLVQGCTNGAWVESFTCTGTDVCTNGDTQEGADLCGLNSEGVYQQQCSNGAWANTTCTGTDVCTNGLTQDGSTACGLNGEGVLTRQCTGGAWVETAGCTGTDICANGSTQKGTTLCGPEDVGYLQQDCADGTWTDTSTCIGFTYLGEGECREADGSYPLRFQNNLSAAQCQSRCEENADWCAAYYTYSGDCNLVTDYPTYVSVAGGLQNNYWGGAQLINGESWQTYCSGNCAQTANLWGGGMFRYRQGYHCYVSLNDPTGCSEGTQIQLACGFNNEGVMTRTCRAGAWKDEVTCQGVVSECDNGNVRNGSTICGLNDEGFLLENCVNGSWVEGSSCTGSEVCVNGIQETLNTTCSDGLGTLHRTCTNGKWFIDTICGRTFSYLGEGECREADRSYPLRFSKEIPLDFFWGTRECLTHCAEHDWCLASYTHQTTCYLVTDYPTFTGAMGSLDDSSWAGEQSINGEIWDTSCYEPCDQTSAAWGGGYLSYRFGYHCFIK